MAVALHRSLWRGTKQQAVRACFDMYSRHAGSAEDEEGYALPLARLEDISEDDYDDPADDPELIALKTCAPLPSAQLSAPAPQTHSGLADERLGLFLKPRCGPRPCPDAALSWQVRQHFAVRQWWTAMHTVG